MGRGKHTKNGKKKWGFKMEELATMVERAQLEKIEFNKKSKRSVKLSKKEYIAAMNESDALESGSSPGRERGVKSLQYTHKTKDKEKRQKHETSTSCPDSTLGFFSSNKGRSISFTGGPNFSYSQFNYTYTYEDNCVQAQSTTTTTMATAAATTITTTTTTSLNALLSPIYVNPRKSSSLSPMFVAPADTTVMSLNEGEEDESYTSDCSDSLDGADSEVDNQSGNHFQDSRLRFDDDEDIEAESYGQLESDNDEGEEEDEDSSQEASSEGDSDGYGDNPFHITTFGFSHPDEGLPENALDSAINDQQSDDSDELESTFGRRKRLKRLERERQLQSSIQGLEPYILPDYPTAANKNGPSYSTPQSVRQQGGEREGPHSWPKKSHMPGSIKQQHRDEESRKVTDFRKSHKRDKKKVQLKSKYVKYYVADFGTPTAARGWIAGGAVKDDDLLHKFADISEPVDVHTPGDLEKPAHPPADVLPPFLGITQECEDGEVENPYEPAIEVESRIASNTSNILHSLTSGSRKTRGNSNKRSNDGQNDVDEQELGSTQMTPKEQKVYEAILAGNFRTLEHAGGKAKKEKSKGKEKSARYPSFGVLELAKLVEDCNDFVQNNHSKSMALYPMTKEQRIQVYSLATLYNFKKESVGRGGNRYPVLLKSKKTAIPHCRALGQFILDCVEAPGSLKTLYLDLDSNGCPPHAVVMAAKWQLEKDDGRERVRFVGGNARFVGENANPVGEDNIGNKMLRGMGWAGGGLGARGEGITEPIAQKIKFSRSGLG